LRHAVGRIAALDAGADDAGLASLAGGVDDLARRRVGLDVGTRPESR
jgi:hypothetical protein